MFVFSRVGYYGRHHVTLTTNEQVRTVIHIEESSDSPTDITFVSSKRAGITKNLFAAIVQSILVAGLNQMEK